MSSLPPEAVSLTGESGQPTILFIHGFLGCKEDWREIISLCPSGYSTLSIDLPGHGANHPDDDADYAMPDCARAIVSMLDSHKIPAVALVGYSMGGRLALYLTVNFPKRVSKAVLLSASAGLRQEAERQARREQDRRLVERMKSVALGNFITDWYRQPVFSGIERHRDRLAAMIARRANNRLSGLVRSLAGMGTGAQPSLWDRLPEINSPLLLVAGENDAKFCSINREMADLCPAARLRILERCSHLAHVEQPKAFAKMMNSFLTAE